MAYTRRRRIYLAARFGRQAEMRDIRAQLESFGYEVLSSWLDEAKPLEAYDRAGRAQLARNCYDEILRVSVFVCFIDKNDKASRGGHQTEFGYAYARGKVTVSVGSVERNIFHEELRVRQFSTVADFLAAARLWTNFMPSQELLTAPAAS